MNRVQTYIHNASIKHIKRAFVYRSRANALRFAWNSYSSNFFSKIREVPHWWNRGGVRGKIQIYLDEFLGFFIFGLSAHLMNYIWASLFFAYGFSGTLLHALAHPIRLFT